MDPTDVTTLEFNYLIKKIREYCTQQRLLESCVQHRKSYTAMCEDPNNVMVLERKVNGGGTVKVPAPQTGQLQLERELQYFIENGYGYLFEQGKCNGFYALNYSYRNEDHEDPLEDDPEKGITARYRRQFPMFEVELTCNFEGLIKFIAGLLKHLGFPVHLAKRGTWVETAKRLGVKDIDREAELRIGKETPIYFLTHFPLEATDGFESTDPFWNMSRDPENPKLTLKVDVIVNGEETFGCAERSCDVEDMKKRFFTQGNGEYHKLLFKIAGNGLISEGSRKVGAELADYWSRPLITRSGFGMGWTRLVRAMKNLNLFPKDLIKANLE